MKNRVFSPWTASYTYITIFNPQGLRTRYDELLPNDSLSYSIVYTYNKKGKKADLAYVDKQLQPTIKKTSLYDVNGYKIDETEYAKDSQVSRRNVYISDARSNMLTTGYSWDGTMTNIYERSARRNL